MPGKPKPLRAKRKSHKSLSRWTVVIPAYNEQHGIGQVIRDVKFWKDAHPNKRNIRILTVNDGSFDATHQIAIEEGVEVIHSDPREPLNNLGKAAAVKAGALHARDVHKSDVIVTLDADLNKIEPRSIDDLMKPVLDEGYHMSIGRTGEGWQFSVPESGNRAIRLSALEPWLRGHPKWKPVQGYGLERGLNALIPESRQKFITGELFRAGKAFRRGERQNAEVVSTVLGIEERRHPVYMARKLRSEGKHKEARNYVANWHAKRGESAAFMKVREKKSRQ
jgi:glycosyltransferase involved in cell wall biosynthesis